MQADGTAAPRAPDPIDAGLAALRSGRGAEAERIFRAILDRFPDHRDACNGMALALAGRGAWDDALAHMDRAVGEGSVPASWHANRGAMLQRLNRHAEALAAFAGAAERGPGNAAFRLQLADAALAMGDFVQAGDAYRQALAIDPTRAAAWSNLGHALEMAGDGPGALAAYRSAIERGPDQPEAWVNLGNALNRGGQAQAALAAFDRALALRPGFPPAESGRGVAFHHCGREEDAIAMFDRMLAANPDDANTHNNRAVSLHAAGRLADAVEGFRRAIALTPGDAAPHNNLGNVLHHAGRTAEALESFGRALELRPDYAEAYNNRGSAREASGDTEAAIDDYRRAVALRPDYPKAHDNLGSLLSMLGRHDEAQTVLDEVLARRPEHLPTRLHAAFARLRIIYRDMDECDRARAAYGRDLAALTAMPLPTDPAQVAELAEAVGASQPFYLAYQGQDDRALQSAYGSFVCRVLAARYPHFAGRPAMPPLGPGERLRVGILSGFFRHHSNWKIPIHGWLEDLDPTRFAVHGYYTQAIEGPEAARARARCARFVAGSRTTAEWAGTIRADRLHVLLIPEIGMDPMTVRLAALRLAPVQATSWGHPQTSGMPSIDDYLSSELMEPPDGNRYYSERLVRLPGLSFRHLPQPVAADAVGRADLGVEEDAVLFWCCQSLFKYLPRDDDLFARIALQLPQARFLFLGYPLGTAVADLFRARMAGAFAQAGLDADRHCRFLGTLAPGRFAGITGLADVFLDSICWSGCNSTIEALGHGLPVVTLPGNLMRGRHSAAILRMIGLDDLIAGSTDEYVAIAVALGRDPILRAAMSRRIAAGRAAIEQDRRPARGLEAYLLAAVGATP